MDDLAIETGAALDGPSRRLAPACAGHGNGRRPRCRYRLGSLLALGVVMACAIGPALAQSPEVPRLDTNQAYVEEVMRPKTLAIDDPMAVFAFVLGKLPDRVIVYPTENYYYFSFIHNGVRFAGNIRIEPQDSGGQTVHFAYYEDFSEWREDTPENHIILDGSRGVTVDRVERLQYRISYGAKSVLFALNDLSQVKPPATAIDASERFIGPICDESGVRFFLIFNPKLKIFHYILDETVSVADEFFSPPATDRILIGKRTGFAFYRDHHLERKILIGAHESNMRLNNYFDGPFDQLPDNFIEGETLRQAILEIQPDLKGTIDRFGGEPTGELRFTIDPYMPYGKIDDLLVMHRCAIGKVNAKTYYDCFDADKVSGQGTQKQTLGRKPTRKSSATERGKESR